MAANSKLKKQHPDFISTILKIDRRVAKEQQRFESVLKLKEDLHNSLQLPVQKEIISKLIPLQIKLIANNEHVFINHLNQLS